MPSVFKRTWLGPGPKGRKVRKVSWGYTLQVDGKQIRRFSAKWSRDDAQNALAEQLLERDAPKEPAKPKALAAVIDDTSSARRASDPSIMTSTGSGRSRPGLARVRRSPR